MKKLFALILVISVFLSACGTPPTVPASSQNTPVSSVLESSSTESSTPESSSKSESSEPEKSNPEMDDALSGSLNAYMRDSFGGMGKP